MLLNFLINSIVDFFLSLCISTTIYQSNMLRSGSFFCGSNDSHPLIFPPARIIHPDKLRNPLISHIHKFARNAVVF